jgi:hypothetical protein
MTDDELLFFFTSFFTINIAVNFINVVSLFQLLPLHMGDGSACVRDGVIIVTSEFNKIASRAL